MAGIKSLDVRLTSQMVGTLRLAWAAFEGRVEGINSFSTWSSHLKRREREQCKLNDDEVEGLSICILSVSRSPPAHTLKEDWTLTTNLPNPLGMI